MASSSSLSSTTITPAMFIVDDSDTRIQYTGNGWLPGGNHDREFAGSTHISRTKGDTASLSFNGTRVGVYGTRRARGRMASVSCVLDGITLPLYTSANDWPINDTFFHVEYCAADVPEDMEHTLVLTIEEDMSSRHSFVLDYIVYDASLGADVDLVPVDGGGLSRVLVDDREEDRIEYEGTWEQKGGGYGHTAPGYAASTSTTNTVGSKATLKFEGTGIRVYGASTRSRAPNNSTWAANFRLETHVNTFADDEESSSTIVTTQRSSSDVPTTLPFAHLPLFLSPDLPNGEHTLTIEYTEGDRELALNYFVYEVPGDVKHGGSGDRPGDDDDALVNGDGEEEFVHESANQTGMIAGIAVAVVVVLLALCVMLVAYRRKKSKRRRADQEMRSANPFFVAPLTKTSTQSKAAPPAHNPFMTPPLRDSTSDNVVGPVRFDSPIRNNLNHNEPGGSRSVTPGTNSQPGSAPPTPTPGRTVFRDGGVSLARQDPPPYRKR